MDNSPLSNLPAEIRNYIYELALSHLHPIIVRDQPLKCKRSLQLSGEWRYPQGLTQTCKQIRTESLPLFYECNDFDVVLPAWNARDQVPNYAIGIMNEIAQRDQALSTLERFIVSIPENVRSIRSVMGFIGSFSLKHFQEPSSTNILRMILIASLRILKHDFGPYCAASKQMVAFNLEGFKGANDGLGAALVGSDPQQGLRKACDSIKEIVARRAASAARSAARRRLYRVLREAEEILEGWVDQL